MQLLCVDCGQVEDALAMQRTPAGPRCAICQELGRQSHQAMVARRVVAVGAPVLGLVALGAGAPVVLVGLSNLGPNAGRIHDASLLVLVVAALAGAGVVAGLLSLGRVVVGSLRPETTLPTLDRVLLPLGGLVAVVLGLIAIPVMLAMWWGPYGTMQTLDALQALAGL